jgi:hypothetical protein
MEISSTREAISVESTHETKTTVRGFGLTAYLSDNANLLDINRNDKAGRFMYYLLVESAATM